MWTKECRNKKRSATKVQKGQRPSRMPPKSLQSAKSSLHSSQRLVDTHHDMPWRRWLQNAAAEVIHSCSRKTGGRVVSCLFCAALLTGMVGTAVFAYSKGHRSSARCPPLQAAPQTRPQRRCRPSAPASPSRLTLPGSAVPAAPSPPASARPTSASDTSATAACWDALQTARPQQRGTRSGRTHTASKLPRRRPPLATPHEWGSRGRCRPSGPWCGPRRWPWWGPLKGQQSWCRGARMLLGTRLSLQERHQGAGGGV